MCPNTKVTLHLKLIAKIGAAIHLTSVKSANCKLAQFVRVLHQTDNIYRHYLASNVNAYVYA